MAKNKYHDPFFDKPPRDFDAEIRMWDERLLNINLDWRLIRLEGIEQNEREYANTYPQVVITLKKEIAKISARLLELRLDN